MNRTGLILIIVFIVLAIITTVLLIVLLPGKTKLSFAVPPQEGRNPTQTFVLDSRLEQYTQPTNFCDAPENINESECIDLQYISDPTKFLLPNMNNIIQKLHQAVNKQKDWGTTYDDPPCMDQIGMDILNLYIGDVKLDDKVHTIENKLDAPRLILFKVIQEIMAPEMRNIKDQNGNIIHSLSFKCNNSKGENICSTIDTVTEVKMLLPSNVIQVNTETPTFIMPQIDDNLETTPIMRTVQFEDTSTIVKTDLGHLQNNGEITTNGSDDQIHISEFTLSALQFRQMLAEQIIMGNKIMHKTINNDNLACNKPAGGGTADPVAGGGGGSTICAGCGTQHACTLEGKYLYYYIGDDGSTISDRPHSYQTDDFWEQAGHDKDGEPIYTKVGDDCFQGNDAWPHVLSDKAP